MSQPAWKLIANLGDVNPIDHGGYFVYEDTTGVYPPEAELLEVNQGRDDDGHDDMDRDTWEVRRFSLDRCTLTDGVLSDNPFHPGLPAWFAGTDAERAERPQDSTYLVNVAEFIGSTAEEMQRALCSDNPVDRAIAYRAIGDYHGFDNFDEYPLTFTDRAEVEARYADHSNV